MKTRIISLLLLLAVLAGVLLTSCGDDDASSSAGAKEFVVAVSADEHITVAEGASILLKEGETAVFHLTFDDGYTLGTTSHGTFDPDTGTLTVEGLTRTTTILLTSVSNAPVGVSLTLDEHVTSEEGTSLAARPGETVVFHLNVDEDYVVTDVSHGIYNQANSSLTVTVPEGALEVTVTTSLSTGKEYGFTLRNGTASMYSGSCPEGAVIRLSPDDSLGIFDCWSVGQTIANGGTLLSDDPYYVFTLNEETVSGSRINVYGNYRERGVTYYANGGTVAGNGSETLFVKPDTSFYTAPNSLGDLGTFIRPGYALLCYNTEADGSGTSYGLGSKVVLDEDGCLDLYCIWAEYSPVSSFSVTEVTTYRGQTRMDGYAITSYTGDHSTVVIPETINGKPVVQINAGAFSSRTNMQTIHLTRNLVTVEAGAFSGCTALKTMYFSDGIYSIPDAAFDAATLASLRDLRVNAVTAPRHSYDYNGMYRVKFDRLVSVDGNRIIVVSGSSSLQGLATEYMEALLDREYTFVEYGTVRTTCNMFYMEAILPYINETDIVIWGPENSIAQMGSNLITWKLWRDTESVYNLWWQVDLRHYDNVFDGYSDFQADRADRREGTYEDTFGYNGQYFDRFGDLQADGRDQYGAADVGRGSMEITLDRTVQDLAESGGDKNPYVDFTSPKYADFVNDCIDAVKAKGAPVYFTFAPMNTNCLTASAKTPAAQAAYDAIIAETYSSLTGILSSSSDAVYAPKYIQDSGFHLNDYGRALRTYRMYRDLCPILGITDIKDMKDLGTAFAGCCFE